MLYTLADITTNSVKIQRSEFICVLYPVSSVENIKDIIAQHNAKYKNATHNCYGYVIGKKQELLYYSDQGEPSGTAGKPILNTLLKHNLTNVLAMVTRYYGGVKLGVRGLIDAYSEAVNLAVLSGSLIENRSLNSVIATIDYSIMDTLKHVLRPYQAEINIIEYSERIKLEISYPEEFEKEIVSVMDDFALKGLLVKE